MFLDNLGLIVTSTGDGGDTAANEGTFATGNVGDTSNYPDIVELLEPKKDGIWVRHPVQYPYPDPDFSRDQEISNVVAMGFFGLKAPLKRLILAHLKRWGLYQNGDIPTPENIGQFIRALGFWPLYPLLWLGDLFMLLNVLIDCFIKAQTPGNVQRWLGGHVGYIFVQGEPNNDQDVPQDVYGPGNVGMARNIIVSIYQAQQIMPTLISFLARKIYLFFRPNYSQMFQMNSINGPQFALDYYFRPQAGGNIEIAEAWTTKTARF